jgi:hypothetical protein
MMARFILATMLALLAPSGACAEPLERFFFTAAQRAELEVMRAKKKEAPAPAPVTEGPAARKPLPRTISYTGIVRRSDGRSMLWINDRLADEREALAGFDLRGRVLSDGSVLLKTHDDDTAVEVKVGQSVEVHTGSVTERFRSKPQRARSSDGSHAGERDDARPDR